ncbi:transcription factor S-II, central domain-containing protein, partial [Piptocephalis cylindrospora]
IGKIVGRLRTNKDAKVASRSGELVKRWKDQILAGKKGPTPTAKTPTPVSRQSPSSTSSSLGSSASSTSSSSPMGVRSIEADKVKFPGLGDRIRDKCVDLLYKALAVDATADGSVILDRAIRIEQAVWVAHLRVSGEKYRAKMRSFSIKLKGSANPSLRHRIVDGDLEVERFCSMSDAEMKSEEQKRKDKEVYDENLFKAQGAAPKTAETDMFQCGKCKQRKCTYYQMQTRSADEPMTTFVTCVVCDHRWKVSRFLWMDE